MQIHAGKWEIDLAAHSEVIACLRQEFDRQILLNLIPS